MDKIQKIVTDLVALGRSNIPDTPMMILIKRLEQEVIPKPKLYIGQQVIFSGLNGEHQHRAVLTGKNGHYYISENGGHWSECKPDPDAKTSINWKYDIDGRLLRVVYEEYVILVQDHLDRIEIRNDVAVHLLDDYIKAYAVIPKLRYLDEN